MPLCEQFVLTYAANSSCADAVNMLRCSWLSFVFNRADHEGAAVREFAKDVVLTFVTSKSSMVNIQITKSCCGRRK